MLLMLAACGPSPPDENDDAGDSTTLVASDTGALPGTTTSSDPTTPPPDPTITSSSSSDTDVMPTSGDETTDAPGVPLQVIPVLEMAPGLSALDGVMRWQPGVDGSCDDGAEPTCTDEPELMNPRLMIDGVLGDATTAPIGARVAVLFPYQSCALGCGTFKLSTSTMMSNTNANGVLPPALPCATPDENLWLAIDLGVLEEPGEYVASLIVNDACETASNDQSISFTPP